MAKEYRRECPDCYSLDMETIFSNHGSGKCKDCHGEGRVTDIVRGLAGPILDFPTDEPCKTCSGTGQCQICGGTGYQYYSDNDSYTDSQESNTEYSDSYGYSASSDYSGSYEDSYVNSSNIFPTEDDSNSWKGLIVGLTICVIAGALLHNYYTGEKSAQDIPVQNKQEEPLPVQSQIKECESNNTGNYSFVNKTNRIVYVFLNSGYNAKKIEVAPGQTEIEYDLAAGQYSYVCTYYTKSNFYNSDVKGDIVVEQCKTKALELNLLPCYRYKLIFDVWKEIHVPEGCCYAVVMPYKNFMIRFGDDSTDHYGNSYAFLHDDEKLIYIKNNFYSTEELEVSIQKLEQ